MYRCSTEESGQRHAGSNGMGREDRSSHSSIMVCPECSKQSYPERGNGGGTRQKRTFLELCLVLYACLTRVWSDGLGLSLVLHAISVHALWHGLIFLPPGTNSWKAGFQLPRRRPCTNAVLVMSHTSPSPMPSARSSRVWRRPGTWTSRDEQGESGAASPLSPRRRRKAALTAGPRQ